MKALKLFLTSLFVFVFSLCAFGGEKAQYHITEGKLHKGGKASVEILEASEEKYIAKLSYELYKKILVPVPSDELKGESILEFPPEFRDERGYMELETKGVIDLPKATLKFVKRLKWGNLLNAYQVIILPKNGKSRIDVIYHPSLKAAGWARALVTFVSSTPVLNGYEVNIVAN